MLIYTKDKSAIDALGPLRRRKAKQRFDALPYLGKLLFIMAPRPAFTNVLFLAASAEAGAAAPRAAYDATATRDAVRARALAASPVGASLEDAAGATVVRAVPSHRVAAVVSTTAPLAVVARASSGRGDAAAVSAALAPAVPSPAQSNAVVMLEAPSLPAAPVVEQAVDSDDEFALDDDDVEEAFAAADEPTPPDAYEAFVNTLDRPTFRRACSLACSRADRERYASLPELIEFGVRIGNLGAALVADSLSEPGDPVTEADVRGGAACPFLPFTREDRRRRAHERPSSATSRRAGPRPGRARAFLGR